MWPEVRGEPLPTFYLRRAQAYRFGRQVLEETFGAGTLQQIHRQTREGPVKEDLDGELRDIEQLFHGAHVTVSRQLGIPAEEFSDLDSGDADHDGARFLDWSANAALDPDLSQDVRMMVPVFYDLMRRQTKVWMLLGWRTNRVYVSFAARPTVQVFHRDGQPLAENEYELNYHGQSFEVVTPVTAEVYVDQLLNRDEFRRLLDTYESQTVILHHLVSHL